ncbi:MAG TPA: radical SAM family heme chaperone HemW [Gemmatimonadaceae bacterium]|nr:radical SAM family heme chaperone HemW [Gemmatimonadaceae bacterium]
MTSPLQHLYVHVPFCARRCSYCDFAIAVRSRVPVGEYVDALRRELSLRFAEAERPVLETLYFGGGTPSRLGGEGVARAIAAVREHATLAPGAELTIEVNPEDVSDEALAAWTEAGVNRLSIGSQSFSESALGWMHRGHGGAGIASAVERARAHGIGNLSLDLIFALPDQVERSWDEDIDRALALEPEHLSLYGLTFEPATPLARWRARGEAAEASEERYEQEFLRAHERLSNAGFDHYEVSNFARPGLASRHNSSYWSGAAYGGVGPSAHAFDGRHRAWNVPQYAEWVRLLAAGADPRAGEEELTGENRVAEEVYLGLRTRRGLVIGPEEAARVASWRDAGWAELDDDTGERRLRLTATGWLRLDSLAADLTLFRSRL